MPSRTTASKVASSSVLGLALAACATAPASPSASPAPLPASSAPVASATPPPPPPLPPPSAAFTLESPSRPAARPVPVPKLLDFASVAGARASADGTRIVYASNTSGRYNLWIADVASGARTRLTTSEQRQVSPVFSPDGKTIAFQSDKDGDEQWDLFVVHPDGTGLVNLTQTPAVSESRPRFSPDGRSLLFRMKPKTGHAEEIALLDLATRKVRAITSGTPAGQDNSGPIFSRDGTKLAYTRGDSGGKDSNVFVVDLRSGASRLVTPHEGQHVYEAADFSPDGSALLLGSNAKTGQSAVALLHLAHLADGAIEWLVSDAWSSDPFGFTPDGRAVGFTHDVDGEQDVELFDLATKQARALPIPPGVNDAMGGREAFTKTGDALFYVHNGPEAHDDLGRVPLAGGDARTVVRSAPDDVDPGDFVRPVLVHYPSTDGKWTISAFAYVPYNLPRDGRAAAVIYVHGGPTGQYTNTFSRFVQAFATRGYVVLAPNVRGSSGYGEAFQFANRFDWGGGDLADVREGRAQLARTGFVDPKKVVVMGGSYGGYMTLMALAKQPDDWAAGVSMVPIANLFTEFAREDPELREYDRFFMGDPETNKALWTDRSPVNFVDRIKAPLLLFAGGNDPRDPPTETTQIGDAVAKRGGVVEVKIYADEGHQFSRRENQIDELQRSVDFVRKYVPAR